jgi:hypothetical protein
LVDREETSSSRKEIPGGEIKALRMNRKVYTQDIVACLHQHRWVTSAAYTRVIKKYTLLEKFLHIRRK